MNPRRLHSPPTLIAGAIDPLRGNMGAEDEFWKGVRISNIQCEGVWTT